MYYWDRFCYVCGPSESKNEHRKKRPEREPRIIQFDHVSVSCGSNAEKIFNSKPMRGIRFDDTGVSWFFFGFRILGGRRDEVHPSRRVLSR